MAKDKQWYELRLKDFVPFCDSYTDRVPIENMTGTRDLINSYIIATGQISILTAFGMGLGALIHSLEKLVN